jgi:type VI secretion system secreted protein Hcp
MRPSLALPLAVALSVVSVSALAASDYFLKIDGIPGESQQSGHVNWLDKVISFQASTSTPAPRTPVKRVATVTRRVDRASLALRDASVEGKHIASVIVEMSKDNDHTIAWRVVLTDVMVSSYRTNTSGGESIPTEEISFNYGKIEWSYRPQKPDGTLADWQTTTETNVVKAIPAVVRREAAPAPVPPK